MKEYIEERAVEIASYLIETGATVRQAAKKFGVSKSTVHKDCSDRLARSTPVLRRRCVMYWILTKRNVILEEDWLPGKNICTESEPEGVRQKRYKVKRALRALLIR